MHAICCLVISQERKNLPSPSSLSFFCYWCWPILTLDSHTELSSRCPLGDSCRVSTVRCGLEGLRPVAIRPCLKGLFVCVQAVSGSQLLAPCFHSGVENCKRRFLSFCLLINRDSLFFLLIFRSGISGLERGSPAVSFKQTKISELSSLQRILAVKQEEYF